ncbi:hypothetical protein RchiOBHm_Chr4g0414291 [Rosa chinensis]|uniref:Uncharacterized protein n=1 Tax=Rosa chinensis TaxID=74649 RepID=A0A2P6QWA0_ROSCH|nr:hypothetical protein RchiOBHm_Chr4g0414291 [Rosa chinensis]
MLPRMRSCMVHRDAARHGSSGRCPAWFIGTLLGMVHRRRCSGMLSLTSLTVEGAVVGRACNRKEKEVESDGMRFEPFVFQAPLLLSPSAFAPLLSSPFLLFMWCLYTALEMSLACVYNIESFRVQLEVN